MTLIRQVCHGYYLNQPNQISQTRDCVASIWIPLNSMIDLVTVLLGYEVYTVFSRIERVAFDISAKKIYFASPSPIFFLFFFFFMKRNTLLYMPKANIYYFKKEESIHLRVGLLLRLFQQLSALHMAT